MFDSGKYLERIGCQKKEPSLLYLKELIRHHQLQVPFENLDIQYKNRIRLDVNDFYKKIVENHRGGYCYELNGLFFHLLKELGFSVEMLHGCFYQPETGNYSRDFDHMMIRALFPQGEFLIDIGTILAINTPIPFSENQVTLAGSDYYKLEIDSDQNWLLKKSSDATSFSIYLKVFPIPVKMIEFLAQNEVHQDDPSSFFVQNKIVSIVTKSGRKQIKNNEFTILEYGEESLSSIQNEDEFFSILEQHFGISQRSVINQEE